MDRRYFVITSKCNLTSLTHLYDENSHRVRLHLDANICVDLEQLSVNKNNVLPSIKDLYLLLKIFKSRPVDLSISSGILEISLRSEITNIDEQEYISRYKSVIGAVNSFRSNILSKNSYVVNSDVLTVNDTEPTFGSVPDDVGFSSIDELARLTTIFVHVLIICHIYLQNGASKNNFNSSMKSFFESKSRLADSRIALADVLAAEIFSGNSTFLPLIGRNKRKKKSRVDTCRATAYDIWQFMTFVHRCAQAIVSNYHVEKFFITNDERISLLVQLVKPEYFIISGEEIPAIAFEVKENASYNSKTVKEVTESEEARRSTRLRIFDNDEQAVRIRRCGRLIKILRRKIEEQETNNKTTLDEGNNVLTWR